MPQQYLSTDPNAGQPASGGGYLSTDPNAGRVISSQFGNVKGGSSSAKAPGYVDRALADNPGLPVPLRVANAAGRYAKQNPVQTGAMVGGTLAAIPTGGTSLMATLASIAATGGGAALGAGAGQLASGQRPDPGTMATHGGTAMLGHGAGTAIAKGAGALARPLAKGVLRLSPRLQREYDDLIGVFLKEKIPVGQAAEAGTRKSASAATARQMGVAADSAGAKAVGPREIVREFRPLRDEVERRAENASPNAPQEMREIVARAKALKGKGSQSVTRNQELKQQAQSDANSAYRAADRGATINDTTAKLDKAVATGRRKASEARMPDRPGVPGVKTVNTRTQDMMGLEDALEDAGMKSQSPLGWNPMNWVGAMMPGATSQAAFGLDRAGRAPLGAAFRNALLALLQSEQEPNRPK